jgi:hypothetical protein
MSPHGQGSILILVAVSALKGKVIVPRLAWVRGYGLRDHHHAVGR